MVLVGNRAFTDYLNPFTVWILIPRSAMINLPLHVFSSQTRKIYQGDICVCAVCSSLETGGRSVFSSLRRRAAQNIHHLSLPGPPPLLRGASKNVFIAP